MRLFSLLPLLILLACTGEPTASERAAALMVQFSQLSDPESLELDAEASRRFITAATDLSDEFPQDTAAALPLYRAAELSQALGDAPTTAQIFRTVHARYPAFSRAPESLFMLGFTQDENLNDLDNARVTYQQFLANYPNHTFADDTEMLLRNLGKSDEEILKSLQAAAAGNEQ